MTGMTSPRGGAPCLWFTRLPLHELFETIREVHFPQVRFRSAVRIQFAEGRRLGELEEAGGTAVVTIHPVLNQATTPAEVFGTLFKRVLWRAREAGSVVGPGFVAICPEETFAEAWLEHHLGGWLVARDGEVEVGSKWREHWLAPRRGEPRLALARALAESELLRLRPHG
jgi:hypothetical protein